MPTQTPPATADVSPARPRPARGGAARLLGWLWPLVFAAELARTAHAQENPKGLAHVPEYTLKQHRFVTPMFVPTPFVSTNIRFQQGVAYLKVPDFPLTKNRSYNVNALGLTERLSGGVRFLGRFQAFIAAQGELLSGINVKSVVLAGTTYNYSLGGGLAARIFRSEATGTQVSARVRATTGPLGLMDLLAFANNIVDRQITAVQDIFDLRISRASLATGTETVFRAEALAAQTLTANFGVQGFLGFAGYWQSISVFDPREDRDVTSRANSYAPEGGLSVDATLLPTVPLSFNLEYSFQSRPRSLSDARDKAPTTQLLHTFALGIHLLDSRFQFGVTVGRAFGLDPIERTGLANAQLTSGKPWNLYGQLQLQYLW